MQTQAVSFKLEAADFISRSRAMNVFPSTASALALVAAAATAVDGHAQTYPAKPIRYIVSGSAGSGTDTLARIITERMSQVVGQQIIVENRPGGGSNIAGEFAAKSPPDGYTLYQSTITMAVNVSLYQNLPYDFVRDFAPVSRIGTAPNVIVAHPSLPAKTAADLIRLAKAKPGSIDYSSGGAGTNSFLAAELFKGQGGVNLVHIAYKGGGPAMLAAVTGEVSLHFAPATTAIPAMQQKRVRAIGVTSLKRLALMPEVPTVDESGLKGYETGNWYGIVVPVKTPRDVVNALHQATVRTVTTPEVVKKLGDLGFVTIGDKPEEFSAFIKSEVERLGKLVKTFNLKPE
jgi:tripartite-type tricarboxylate transporter receptor subunit TctC